MNLFKHSLITNFNKTNFNNVHFLEHLIVKHLKKIYCGDNNVLISSLNGKTGESFMEISYYCYNDNKLAIDEKQLFEKQLIENERQRLILETGDLTYKDITKKQLEETLKQILQTAKYRCERTVFNQYALKEPSRFFLTYRLLKDYFEKNQGRYCFRCKQNIFIQQKKNIKNISEVQLSSFSIIEAIHCLGEKDGNIQSAVKLIFRNLKEIEKNVREIKINVPFHIYLVVYIPQECTDIKSKFKEVINKSKKIAEHVYDTIHYMRDDNSDEMKICTAYIYQSPEDLLEQKCEIDMMYANEKGRSFQIEINKGCYIYSEKQSAV